ncbi:MAG: YceI family protein [bacterium]|nr:YceI family protein [bacterium]MDE0352549.1 YceI family protein [bacterium]
MRMARRIGLALAAIVVLVLGAAAYVWFSGGSGEPSTEVTAPPITSPPTTAPATTAPSTTTATSVPATTTVATTAAPADAETTEPADAAGAPAVLYRIDKAESSVSFEIDEILNGNPFRVVGVTTEVAGEVLIDFDEPAASQLGTIVINVRTLATDSGFRDRAIRGPILGSSRDENEFATFEPTDIEGLPDSVTVGDQVPLRITGTFTLSGEARPVTFDTEVTVVSDERVEVTGTATVMRSDFGLTIPDIPSVSDVADEILLVIDLVAVAAGV